MTVARTVLIVGLLVAVAGIARLAYFTYGLDTWEVRHVSAPPGVDVPFEEAVLVPSATLDAQAGLIIFGLFFATMGAASWVAWRWFRQAASRWEAVSDALRAAGFVPADDPGVAGRLRSRAPAGTPAPRLLRRQGLGVIEWVACPPARMTGSPTAVAIQSDRLALPRFLLLPGVHNGDGRGYATDAHLHELLSPDTPEMRYPPIPLAGTGHTLSADRAGWVEPLFDAGFRAWLATTNGLALRGDGDLLVVWLGPRGPGWAPVLESDPHKGLALASHAYEALRHRD